MVLFLNIVERYGVSWPYVRKLMATSLSIPLTARRRAASRRTALLQIWRKMLPHPCGISVVNLGRRIQRGLP